MMKKLIIAAVLALAATACQPGADYKTERDEVMKFHDVVMEDHGKVVDNQMRLDTLIRSLPVLQQKFPEMDTLQEKSVMIENQNRLNKAEDLMNDWMHKFEPDITGKSNEEAVVYFRGERRKIAMIDSIYKEEIKLSDDYLSKFKR